MYGYNNFRPTQNFGRVTRSVEPNYSNVTWVKESKKENRTLDHDVRLSNGQETQTFSITFELGDLRKERPGINPKYMEALLQRIIDELKGKKGYVSSAVYLGTIDYYDGDVYPYEVPVVRHSKGDRKIKTSETTHYSIPKGWSVECSITFEGEMSMRMRNAILTFLAKQVHFELTPAILRQLKKEEQKWNETKLQKKHAQASLLHFDSYDYD